MKINKNINIKYSIYSWSSFNVAGIQNENRLLSFLKKKFKLKSLIVSNECNCVRDASGVFRFKMRYFEEKSPIHKKSDDS